MPLRRLAPKRQDRRRPAGETQRGCAPDGGRCKVARNLRGERRHKEVVRWVQLAAPTTASKSVIHQKLGAALYV